MKNLLFVTLLTTTLSLNAQNKDFKYSLNIVYGTLYGNDFNMKINPSIGIAYSKVMVGFTLPRVGPFETAYNSEYQSYAFSTYFGLEVADNVYPYLTYGQFGTRFFGWPDSNYNERTFTGTISFDQLGVGVLYFSDNKHYTLGADVRYRTSQYGPNKVLYPSITLGVNFTNKDFKNFINFIK